MASSSIRVIQEAIYAVLVADTGTGGVMDLATAVVNDIPTASGPSALAPPYVLISQATEAPWNTFGGPTVGLGWETIARVHIYSRYEGDLEATQILDRIVALLNFQPLTVVGFGSVMVENSTNRVLVETKDKLEWRHIVAEFRVTVHQ
jgi:hypothetical protein